MSSFLYLSIILWDIDPQIITSLDFFRWYGLLWAIGIISGIQVLKYIFKVEQVPQDNLDKLVTFVIFGIIIGARLGHIIFYDPIYYWNNPIEILPIKLEPHFQFTGLAGLASHGGVVGALLGLSLYIKKYKQNYLWILDRLTISASLLGCFIRVGNLMNSEIIGTPTSVPWAFVFTRVDQIPRHPAQLYEAVFYLMIFILLFLIWRSNKVANTGFIFGLGLMLIFLQRFLVEFVKENQVAFENKMILNMGQILSIPMILIGLYFIVKSYTNKKLKAQ